MWAAFGNLKATARTQTLVSGWLGLTYSKGQHMVTEPKGGYDVDVCKSWRTGLGCGAAGHRAGDCKQLRTGPTEYSNNRNNRSSGGPINSNGRTT